MHNIKSAKLYRSIDKPCFCFKNIINVIYTVYLTNIAKTIFILKFTFLHFSKNASTLVGAVTCLDLCPEGKLATGGVERTVKVWTVT